MNQRLQAKGIVVNSNARTVTSKKTGEPFTFYTALIVGEDTLAEVRFRTAEDFKAATTADAELLLSVIIDTYRGQVTLEVDEWTAIPKAKK